MSVTVDAYGRSVAFSYTDGTSDYYLVGSSVTVAVPTGSVDGVVAVACAIQGNLSRFSVAVKTFRDNLYDSDTRLAFTDLYINAQANSLTNRLAYINQLIVWQTSVIAYSATYIASVQALVNPATIAATLWNFNLISTPDPQVTLMGAVAISN